MLTAPYQKTDLDIVGQIQPYWLYKRIHPTAGIGFAPPVLPAFVLFTVPYGFNYLARRVSVQWDDVNDGGNIINPEARVEVYNRAQSRARQSGAWTNAASGYRENYAQVPLDTVSSPAGRNTRWNVAPAPVDQTAFGINFTATPRKSSKIVNLIFPYNDTIEVRIVGTIWTLPAADIFPNYVDVLVEGYMIPEAALAMWQGGNDG